MRRVVFFYGAVLLLAASYALADDAILPNSKLTPGSVLTTDTTLICKPGYSKTVRHTSGKLKRQIYAEYGVNARAGHYEIDHLIPLGIGGADTRENLWPESYDTQPGNALAKDRLEDFLHTEVCSGRISITQAQKEIAADWIAAYRKYLRSP
jgi:hypothetical protein